MRLALVTLAVAAATAAAPSLAAAPTILAQGTFGPAGKYTGRGTATVVRVAGGRELRLSQSFAAFNAIRLRIYLATDPSARVRIDLGPAKLRGAQRFRVPARADLKRYRYVIAWCVAVNEPITQAVLRSR